MIIFNHSDLSATNKYIHIHTPAFFINLVQVKYTFREHIIEIPHQSTWRIYDF